MEYNLDQLSAELFKTFSRFEYSLKASGFNNGDGIAVANWRNFAESVNKSFENPINTELQMAINYILDNPPKKQIVEKGRLEWKESTPSTDLKSDLILLYVRRVRNNLFHGGKLNGHWFDPERSVELLTYSLTILYHCLEISKTVKEAYDN